MHESVKDKPAAATPAVEASGGSSAPAVAVQLNAKPGNDEGASDGAGLSGAAAIASGNPFQLQSEQGAPKKANQTGLPDGLKSGVETLSGFSLDDVKVHYQSPKPAQLQAHAYAQGSDIHIGPGQEKHLPHEAWHVVQQKQGRVQASTQLKGAAINDEPSLESEATEMGIAAVQLAAFSLSGTSAGSTGKPIQRVATNAVIQRNNEWASPAIRAQIADGKSGHHIVAKEDLSLLLTWAKEDSKPPTSHPKATNFASTNTEKGLHNKGFNVTVGFSDYSNDPGSNWDAGTEKKALGATDAATTGLTATEMTEYGIEKRANNATSALLRPLQEMIDARKEKPKPFSNAQWDTIGKLLKDGNGTLDAATVNAYKADEWADDITLETVTTKKDKLVKAGEDEVTVDGTYIKVDGEGTLTVGGEKMDLQGKIASNDGGKLKVDGEQVTVTKTGTLTVGDEALKKATDSKYRKRAGYLLTNLEGNDESIFLKTAKTNRKAEIPTAELTKDVAKTEDDSDTAITIAYGHVLLRHSLQWWGGETTNRNVFFMPGMDDDAILAWCKARADEIYTRWLLPVLKAEKKRFVAEEVPENQRTFTKHLQGNSLGFYTDVTADAVFLEPIEEGGDEVGKYDITLNCKSLSPSESSGLQILQKHLIEFKNNNGALPVAVPEEGGEEE